MVSINKENACHGDALRYLMDRAPSRACFSCGRAYPQVLLSSSTTLRHFLESSFMVITLYVVALSLSFVSPARKSHRLALAIGSLQPGVRDGDGTRHERNPFTLCVGCTRSQGRLQRGNVRHKRDGIEAGGVDILRLSTMTVIHKAKW